MAHSAIRALRNGWGGGGGRTAKQYVVEARSYNSNVTKVLLAQPVRPGDIVILMGRITASQAPADFTSISAASTFSANYKVMAGGETEIDLRNSASGTYLCYHLRDCEPVFTHGADSSSSGTFIQAQVPRPEYPALYFFAGNVAAQVPFSGGPLNALIKYLNTGSYYTIEPWTGAGFNVTACVRTGSAVVTGAVGISVKVKP